MSQPLGLVLGGSGAIGRAAARCLLDAGYEVVATHRCPQPPDEAAVRWVRFDAVTGETDALREQVESDPRPLQAVVFAIGMPSSKKQITDTQRPEWDELLAVNALALPLAWRAIAASARAGKARVVVISSEAARTVSAASGPYSASKAALEAIAVTLAREEAVHGVRVNVLSPSLVDSPQAEQVLARAGKTDPAAHYRTLPWQRALTTAEVAGAATALVHDPSWAYTTGQVLRMSANLVGR
jgi:3-oxoacyl-[acyl-carrier protein] reductase